MDGSEGIKRWSYRERKEERAMDPYKL